MKIKKDFIKVNKTVFDYRRYIREVEWLKFDVKRRILDLLRKDFIVLEKVEESYDSLYMAFYNRKLDIKLEIECFKDKKEIFV